MPQLIKMSFFTIYILRISIQDVEKREAIVLKKKELDELLDQNIIKKKRIPILIRDNYWKKVFSQKINRTMEGLIKQLQKLLTEEAENNKQLKLRRDRKQQLMAKILTISDLVNSKGEENALSELEKCTAEINTLNAEMEGLLKIVEEYPEEIVRVNLELLKESLRVAYGEFIDNHEDLGRVNEEINRIRERLNVLRIEKEDREKKEQALYTFIHSMIGHEEIEKLDIHFLKDK